MRPLMSRVCEAIEAQGGEVCGSDGDVVVFAMPGRDVEITLDIGTLRQACQGRGEAEILVRVEERVRAAFRAGSAGTVLNLEEVLPHLRPPGSGGPWRRVLVDDLLDLCLVEDGAVTMRYLQPMDLVRAELSLSEVDALCMDNLFARAPQAGWAVREDLGSGVVECRVGDGHDAARALICHRWFPAEERVLFLVPSRDHLWAVPGSTSEAEAVASTLRPLARAVAIEASYPLSDAVFVNTGGRLEVLSPPGP